MGRGTVTDLRSWNLSVLTLTFSSLMLFFSDKLSGYQPDVPPASRYHDMSWGYGRNIFLQIHTTTQMLREEKLTRDEMTWPWLKCNPVPTYKLTLRNSTLILSLLKDLLVSIPLMHNRLPWFQGVADYGCRNRIIFTQATPEEIISERSLTKHLNKS